MPRSLLGRGPLGFDSWKRPPPVSDHSVFAFWVVAYGGFDCTYWRGRNTECRPTETEKYKQQLTPAVAGNTYGQNRSQLAQNEGTEERNTSRLLGAEMEFESRACTWRNRICELQDSRTRSRARLKTIANISRWLPKQRLYCNSADETATGHVAENFPDPCSMTLFANWQLCLYYSGLYNG